MNPLVSGMLLISSPSKNLFRRLPPEIRITIYRIALLQPVDPVDEESLVQGSTHTHRQHNRREPRAPLCWQLPSKTLHPSPELLATLRANPDLYSEALVIFYKINAIPLTKDTVVSFHGIKEKTLALIQRMNIFLTKEDSNHQITHLTNSNNSELYLSLPVLKHLELVIDKSCYRLFAFGMNRLMLEHLLSVDNHVFWFEDLDDGHWCHNIHDMKNYSGPFLRYLKERDVENGDGRKWRGVFWESWKVEEGKDDVRDPSKLRLGFWRENVVANGEV